MLESLHIQNFAIIEELTVTFGRGLNILTGETGAGKSILIGAIQLLLGAKGSADQVRQGADEAVVEGLFDLSGEAEIQALLTSRGVASPGQVTLRRVLSRGGRSRAYVNGQFCTLQMLSELGREWVNIYGQHEHQLLLQSERHLDLLDEFGESNAMRDRWGALWQTLGGINAEIQEAENRRREAEVRRDLWEFQVKEIEAAGLHPQEEEALTRERQLLIHAQRIREGLHRAEEALYGEEGSALERVQAVSRTLQELAKLDQQLGAAIEALSSAALQLEEAVQQVRERIRRVALDPQRLEALEDRLAEILRLKRKYKADVPAILSLAGDLKARLQELEQGEEALEGLLERRTALEEELVTIGLGLREARQRGGETLSRGVAKELRDLGIAHPVFEVDVAPLREGLPLGTGGVAAGPRGLDRAEFVLSTNLGESPRSLSRIASGGELSRIMLALKRVLAEAGRVPTLIFDEIDAGIGGAVADALGEKLAHIAGGHQVLCVTHLPQVACHAGRHLRVLKGVRSGRTVTEVAVLDTEDRVEELSRMLGGKVVTERARAHARELLQRAGWR